MIKTPEDVEAYLLCIAGEETFCFLTSVFKGDSNEKTACELEKLASIIRNKSSSNLTLHIVPRKK